MNEQECRALLEEMEDQIVQHPDEFWRLTQVVQSLNPKKILEVGTANGGTLRMWQRVVGQDGQTYGVDTNGNNLVDHSGYPAPIMIVGDSHAEATIEAVRAHAPFDFCFIDGDHSYEGCKADWENYAPMVRPGGVVAFHDVGSRLEQEPGKVFRGINLPKENYYVVPGMGVGIVRLPA